MQLDRNMLNRLLSMNDTQLAALIEKIAAESGLDLSAAGLNKDNIESLRRALQSVTDADLAQYNAIYESYNQSRKKK